MMPTLKANIREKLETEPVKEPQQFFPLKPSSSIQKSENPNKKNNFLPNNVSHLIQDYNAKDLEHPPRKTTELHGHRLDYKFSAMKLDDNAAKENNIYASSNRLISSSESSSSSDDASSIIAIQKIQAKQIIQNMKSLHV